MTDFKSGLIDIYSVPALQHNRKLFETWNNIAASKGDRAVIMIGFTQDGQPTVYTIPGVPPAVIKQTLLEICKQWYGQDPTAKNLVENG